MLFIKFTIVLILKLFLFEIVSTEPIDIDYNTGRIPTNIPERRNALPMINVQGSHFEVGYAIGQTYKYMIQDYVEKNKTLKEYINLFNTTEKTKKLYAVVLENTEKYFPQYLVELKGIAKGSDVPFHHLFLLHIDYSIKPHKPEEVNFNLKPRNYFRKAEGTGCSTVRISTVNGLQFIGHNEDALLDSINHVFIVSAHIKPSDEEKGGLFEAREERWEAFTYAGYLSGYGGGHNFHGLAFTINRIFPENVIPSNMPRMFLMRALLAAKADINEIKHILINSGLGSADALHVNVGLLDHRKPCQNGSTQLFSIDVTPSEGKSNVNIEMILLGTTFYANRFRYPLAKELECFAWYSSEVRENRFMDITKPKQPENLIDILNILGDTNFDHDWEIYKETNKRGNVNTILTGVFDFNDCIWKIWATNPKKNTSILHLNLIISNTENNIIVDHV